MWAEFLPPSLGDTPAAAGGWGRQERPPAPLQCLGGGPVPPSLPHSALSCNRLPPPQPSGYPTWPGQILAAWLEAQGAVPGGKPYSPCPPARAKVPHLHQKQHGASSSASVLLWCSLLAGNPGEEGEREQAWAGGSELLGTLSAALGSSALPAPRGKRSGMSPQEAASGQEQREDTETTMVTGGLPAGRGHPASSLCPIDYYLH